MAQNPIGHPSNARDQKLSGPQKILIVTITILIITLGIVAFFLLSKRNDDVFAETVRKQKERQKREKMIEAIAFKEPPPEPASKSIVEAIKVDPPKTEDGPPPPLPYAHEMTPVPGPPIQASGLWAYLQESRISVIAKENTYSGNYKVTEILPGEESPAYASREIKSGAIRISKGDSIEVRSYDAKGQLEWLAPAPESGTYPTLSDAAYVSFFSPTRAFAVIERN